MDGEYFINNEFLRVRVANVTIIPRFVSKQELYFKPPNIVGFHEVEISINDQQYSENGTVFLEIRNETEITSAYPGDIWIITEKFEQIVYFQTLVLGKVGRKCG